MGVRKVCGDYSLVGWLIGGGEVRYGRTWEQDHSLSLLCGFLFGVEYSEIIKLYTENLGERKIIENFILSEGPEDRLFTLRNRNAYQDKKLEDERNLLRIELHIMIN